LQKIILRRSNWALCDVAQHTVTTKVPQFLDSNFNDELDLHSQVVELCSSREMAQRVKDVCEMVRELEDAHERGFLEKHINRVGMKSLLGIQLFRYYQRLALKPPVNAKDFLSYWVNFALESFSSSLRPPTRIYELISGSSFQDGRCNLKVIHDEQTLFLKQHQLISCRYWGIWFNTESTQLDNSLTTFILIQMLMKLASDLSCIKQMARAFVKGGTKLDELRMTASGVGIDFLRIIHDVLNEHEHIAHIATLIEDVMERTDLRLRYQKLNRKRGARVQISYAGKAEHHFSKLAKIHLGEEYVFLSPYGLAHTILHESSSQFLSSINWNEFWCNCSQQTNDDEELAMMIKRNFDHAMSRATDHPMGPMGILRPELKQVIRAVAEHDAFLATVQLRRRERKLGQFLPSSKRQGR
jgi:hypothetical protein